MYDLDKLQDAEDKINNAFEEVTEAVNDYFNEFGDKNGMDFKYDFVKYQEQLNDINDIYKKIFNRVRERIKYKNNEEKGDNSQSVDNKTKVFRKRF